MQTGIQGSGELAPGKLLTGFARGRIVLWIAVATGIHIVLITLLSLGYIRDRWIDPEGAAARKEAAALAAQAAQQKEGAAKPGQPAATGRVARAAAPGAAATTNAPATNAASGAADQIPADRTNAPIIKRITDKATPAEIPKQPGDIGISLDDTNTH
jgi:hypothetical protein